MKRIHPINHQNMAAAERRGSTLLIVLALLSLLAFTGMVFYTFTNQERAAAEYFSEAAKAENDSEDDPFPWGLRQLLVGPSNTQKRSILWGPTRRHSMVTSVVGYDAVPYSGTGVHIIYDPSTGLPVPDQNYDGVADTPASPLVNTVNLVDALTAWGAPPFGINEGQLRTARRLFPEPDVDYTYPDHNHVWLAYRGWAIRDNGAAAPASQRYERVPVLIPSFMRPALLKSSNTNGPSGTNTITDMDWYDHTAHPVYAVRSFRPSPLHIVGFDGSGNPIRRYIDAANPADGPLIATYGAFPLRPSEDVNPANFGRMGLLTGHPTGTVTAADPDGFRLDQDNDGDGIFEGIWIDLGYPVEETQTGELYSTLYSFTIYDLDSLIDLNSHGNIANLFRNERVTDQVGAGAGGTTPFPLVPVSASHEAIGPHEVNPLYALAPPTSTSTDSAFSDALRGYGAVPSNRLEQANMEWLWLVTGRIDDTNSVWDGRWGDASILWYHIHGNDGSGGSAGPRTVWSLPRPGRAGQVTVNSTFPISFGGKQGFDDNQNALYGLASTRTGRLRGFRHLVDIGGTGTRTRLSDPRVPLLVKDLANSPERWPQYLGYSLTGASAATPLNDPTYLAGRDQNMATPGDNLISAPRLNLAFEDALEFLNDEEFSMGEVDSRFAPGDLIWGHLRKDRTNMSQSELSKRLSELAVAAFSDTEVSERFTTITNTLRAIPYRHDLGINRVSDGGTGDDGPRWWAWSADTDGQDVDGDGLPDGDGRPEFPPAFGTTPANGRPYTATDPFRGPVRQLLTCEVGEDRRLVIQLPLSINHLLDVERAADTPPDGTPAFYRYMQRAGIRFRPLTEHPRPDETDNMGNTFSQLMTSVPVLGTPAGNSALRQFPPRTFAQREFWARRDRQLLARDIYVLLYTLGTAEVDSATGRIENVLRPNSGGTRSYTDEELHRMAQFAVNLVDAMDTDDVVTTFEYDKDLSDGWNLDDDPYTTGENVVTSGAGTQNGRNPLDSATRGVVFGVEAQQLSLNESLAVRFEDFSKYPGTVDDPTTPWTDTSSGAPLADPDTERRDRYVLHLELQNNQPYPVPLSLNGVTGTTNGEHAIWQLARVDRTTAGASGPNQPSDAPQQNTLDPLASPTGVDGTTMSFMDGNPVIGGGERFSIAFATVSNTGPTDALRTDPLGTGSADLYLQKPMATDYALISPDEPAIAMTAGSTPAPRTMLDTIHTSHDGRYIYDANNTDKGHFLRDIPYPMGGSGREYYGNELYDFDPAAPASTSGPASGQGFEVVLRRRLNPYMPQVPLTENPWVEVDRMRIEFKDFFSFTPIGGGNYSVSSDFSQITSDERIEPLHAGSADDSQHPPASTNPAVDNYRYNTITYSAAPPTPGEKGVNDATTAVNGGRYNLWQPHFDRDYTSVAELLQLPLVGPRLLTQRLNRMRYSPAQQLSVNVNAVDPDGDPSLAGSAVALFLQPDALTSGATGTNGPNDNAWYQLLQFVEVPSGVNEMLGNYLKRRRLPGKINLNGIRHIEVYAGLIDDPLVADVPHELVPGSGAGGVKDDHNQFAPFMNAGTTPSPLNPNNSSRTPAGAGAQTGRTAVLDAAGNPITGPAATSYRDRWFELIAERDGATAAIDTNPARPGGPAMTTWWVPGTPNAKPFRPLGHRRPVVNSTASSDANLDESVLRRLAMDQTDGNNASNRHWLELGSRANHNDPLSADAAVSQRERHQILAKVLNNSTTVSNTFIVYATAGYFRSYEDPATGLIRVGRRMGLDLDSDGNETNDAGWEKRAVFIIDRTELLNAYDEGTGSFDWRRLIKYRADLPSDGQ